MKNKLFMSTLLGLAMSVSFVATANAQAPRALINAIDNTVNANFSVEATGELSYGESKMSVDIDAVKRDNRYKETDNVELFVNLSDFGNPELQGTMNAEMGVTVYFDLEAQQLMLRVNSIGMEMNLEDALMNEAANGIFEMVKFSEGKTFEMNFADIEAFAKKHMSEDSEDLDELFNALESLDIQKEFQENAGDLVKIILESGLFQVTNFSANTYIITLADNPEITDAKKLLEAVADLPFLPAMIREEVSNEAERMTNEDIEEIRAESREELANLADYVDLKLQYQLDGQIIRFTKEEITLKSEAFRNEGVPFMYDVVLTADSAFTYTPQVIELPQITDATISLTKMVNGMMAIGIMEQRAWQEWEDSYEYDEDYDWEEDVTWEDGSATKRYVLEEYEEESTWYGKYYTYLLDINVDIEQLLVLPEDKVTFAQLDELIYLAKLNTNWNVEPNSNVSQDTVTREEGLKIMMEAFFFEYDYSFAVTQGFVNPSYAVGQNRTRHMNFAELAKILAEIVNYTENAAG